MDVVGPVRDSTIRAVADFLADRQVTSAVRSWADELISAGFDQAPIIEAAIVEEHEWQRLPSLVADILGVLGFATQPTTLADSLRMLLVERLRDPAEDARETIDMGYRIGIRFGYLKNGIADLASPFWDFVDLSDDLDLFDQGIENSAFEQMGLRAWSLAYLAREVRGVIGPR